MNKLSHYLEEKEELDNRIKKSTQILKQYSKQFVIPKRIKVRGKKKLSGTKKFCLPKIKASHRSVDTLLNPKKKVPLLRRKAPHLGGLKNKSVSDVSEL